MDQGNWLAEQFEEHRARLRAVAYRMLGSPGEADDAVQEAWLRFSRADTSAVQNLGSWLTTLVSRVCLNALQTRRSRPESPLAEEVPEPAAAPSGADPEFEAILADSVGLALVVVLDTLTPAERVAFVLHDMFVVPFEEIAPIIGRSTPAARQLASRARRRVRGQQADRDGDRRRRSSWSTRSLPQPARATSPRCLPCWTPTWCSPPTRRRCGWPPLGRHTARRGSARRSGAGKRLPKYSPDERQQHRQRLSTAIRERCGRPRVMPGRRSS